MKIQLPRRRLLLASAALGASGGLSSILAHAQATAAITRDGARPAFPSGVQSGDVLADRGIVWSRCDRPACRWVDWSTTASFANARRVRGPYAQQSSDHSARIDLTDLPTGQEIVYRVRWEDLAGQGFGISDEFGGMKICKATRKLEPDFFIHCGDTIYADGPSSPRSSSPTAASGATAC